MSEVSPPVHRKFRLTRKVGFIALTVFLCTVFTGAAGLYVLVEAAAGIADALGGNRCDASVPANIEYMARFELPSSAENLWSECSGLQGYGASARFDIDPADLDVFLQSTSLTLPLSDTASYGDFTFFDVAPATYLYGEYSSEAFFQKVLVDTSNPQRYTIYVEVLGG